MGSFNFEDLQVYVEQTKHQPVTALSIVLFSVLVSVVIQKAFYRLFLHPLAKFPGPVLARSTTGWKAFTECFLNRSLYDVVKDIHAKYGDVVRIGPNELHFSNPQAYHEIYNNKNRWDKEWHLYHSFGEDRSSFGFITYKESKERKDVLNRMFSHKAVLQTQGLIVEKINALCKALERHRADGKPADLFWAFRCMTMDIVCFLCYGSTLDAINAPGFKAPIIEAMDASLPVFIRFKHFEWYKNMIVNCPPNISRVISPSTRGLVDMQEMFKKQISELAQNPEKLQHLPHNMTIYHQLMDKEAYRTNTVPCEGSLYEEAQALMYAGSDTTGNTLMVGAFHMLKKPETYKKFKDEIKSVWPNLQSQPELRDLERLPYFNAVIKEALRISVGVISGLLRIVPEGGATICGTFVPGGTIVSCGAPFVHFNKDIFANPDEFIPERWIENPDLDNWLVSFSRGPRACLGINLAWLELRLAFAHIYRKFDLELAPGAPSSLPFREAFLPFFYGPHVLANVTPVQS